MAKKKKFCKIWYLNCVECGSRFIASMPYKKYCSVECEKMTVKKKKIQRKILKIPVLRSSKFKNFSPRYHVIENCLIVERHHSRCEEYLRGECEKCFEYCVDCNWVGWYRLRKLSDEEKGEYERHLQDIKQGRRYEAA